MASEVEDIIQEPSESQKRITELSGKLKEKAEAEAAAKAKAEEAEKRATFAEGFADILSTHPAAKDFKNDIQAKVMSGMSVEDATYAILGKAGKLSTQTVPESPPSPIGGSAPNIPQEKPKTPNELSQAERRKLLEESLIVT